MHELSTARNSPVEVHALRSSREELPPELTPLIDKQIFDENDLDNDYDIFFVTNPTCRHHETLQRHVARSEHFYIEKPLFDGSADQTLQGIALKPESIYHVACQMRFHKVISFLKEEMLNRKAFAVRCICSSYLPDWRPQIDYRKNYSAIKSLGGGVSLDLIHELDYLTHIWGMPQSIQNMRGTFSNLDIDSDDISLYLSQHDQVAISLHLDYFGRVPRRVVEVFVEDDLIICDLIKNRMEWLKSGRVESFDQSRNDMFLAELNYFLDCVDNNRESENSVEHACRILNLTKGNC
ncbi:MAG: gfo/Idh/MocA family oxidoreductase [bacterium]|nr:gfo/Idh/MocA family oxidoreductase [bacterium]